MFDKLLSHRLKISIKMIHVYEICSKNLKVSANTSVQFQRRNSKSEICTELFVKYLMTKLDIHELSRYMSPLRAIVKSKQYSRITAIW